MSGYGGGQNWHISLKLLSLDAIIPNPVVPIAWIFGCFWASLCWCGLSSNDWVMVAYLHHLIVLIRRSHLSNVWHCPDWNLAEQTYFPSCYSTSKKHWNYAWTDSTIVLNWLDGNPRMFKTFVGNRVSCTLELIPSNHWHHVSGLQNPADCASRGIFPSELLEHALWWDGPEWLYIGHRNTGLDSPRISRW